MFSKFLSWFRTESESVSESETESESIFPKPPSFSKNTPNKIGEGIKVSGRNTLIKTDDNGYRVSIADEPIDAKVDGKKFFCVRVENAGPDSRMMFGFTPMETFDSKRRAYFGNGFSGAGIGLFGGKIWFGAMYFFNGDLWYPDNKHRNIIYEGISKKAKEIIVILTISNNGKKKVIRFLVDGVESKTTDVSEYLEGNRLFPAICMRWKNQQVTTIPIDKIEIRTPEIENLIKEQQQPKNNSIEEVKQARNDFRQQNEQMMYDFFKQFEQQQAKENEDEVRVETKKENKKEKKVATKKTKKETKPKTTKATKKKEENKNNKEKKTKAKK
jgi:hypothetical protein